MDREECLRRRQPPRRRQTAQNDETAGAADTGTLADIGTVALGAGAGDWDVALVGDGAGRGWDKPGGWSCVLIDRHGSAAAADGAARDARKLFSGGMNLATLEITELMPYVHAMLWYDRYHGRDRRVARQKEVLDVLVITDRQSIAQLGAKIQADRARAAEVHRKHPLWTVVSHLERQGYRFFWVHRDRNEIGLNSLMDRMADSAKHAAANALAQARAHVRDDLPGAPSEEDLIYLFNASAFGTPETINPAGGRRYGKTAGPDGAGV